MDCGSSLPLLLPPKQALENKAQASLRTPKSYTANAGFFQGLERPVIFFQRLEKTIPPPRNLAYSPRNIAVTKANKECGWEHHCRWKLFCKWAEA
ncbi:MAG: hypothetical protein WC047_07390 [Kiritimatiellales bacterium]